MKTMIRSAALLGMLVLSSTAWAQIDPYVGTWKLNLAKSKYNAGQPPKSSTVVVEADVHDGRFGRWKDANDDDHRYQRRRTEGR